MQDYPHRYKAAAQGAAEGVIDTGSPGLESIPTMPPPEFDGPGEAVSWVFDRVVPRSEAERREIEEFIGFLWRKKGR